jgi:shikimate dehydrogenase
VQLEALASLLPQVRLLVNATSAGMAGRDPLPIDLGRLPRDCVVNDIVYVPALTPLLKEASARGLRTVGGLGMLLHQAVPGFARWFGRVPTVTPALRRLVEADIAASVA